MMYLGSSSCYGPMGRLIMSLSDVTITFFECKSCAFYLCERKTYPQDGYKPIHEGSINPSQQSEARSNDGENAIRTAESGLDHKKLLC